MSSTGASDDSRFDRNSTCDVEFDWEEGDAPALAVVEVAAAISNQEPTSMEPLNNVIDTDALNRLFTPREGTLRHDGFVEFRYEGCRIRLRGDGTVSALRAE